MGLITVHHLDTGLRHPLCRYADPADRACVPDPCFLLVDLTDESLSALIVTTLRYVQELLGHSKPETTISYTHIMRIDLCRLRATPDNV